jgi:hypothetical protein
MDENDDPGVQAEREALQSVMESARNRIVETQEDVNALTMLREVADFGSSLLLIGQEVEVTHDNFDEHWAQVLSDAHRDVWEYLWSIPDGVPRAR